MARCFPRTLFCQLGIMFFLGSIMAADASQILLKSGDVYTNATILRRDAASIVIRVQYGTMTLPLDLVDRIDGLPVHPALAATPASVARTPAPRPAPAASAAPAVVPTPHAKERALPSVPREPASVSLDGTGDSTPLWQIAWVILGAVIALVLWSLTLPRLHQDLQARRHLSRGWYAAALLLPGVGYLGYLVRRFLARRIEQRHAEILAQNHFEFLDADSRPIHVDATSAVLSGIENAKAILENALFKRASDVHIEPAPEEYRVRLRVDGSMLPARSFPNAEGVRLVSAIKTLAQIDIAERRKAQDGRFGARQGRRSVDFRVATVPSVHGEKLVLRILDRKSGVRGLDDIGMPQEMMDRFAQIVHSRSGMILATGPTGSGKTSTLYAALAQLDARQLNLVTIEDPVEYELAGATQIPVNVKAGVTYESGLRSILRQDPDVILVGEMRDLESAQIALRSALTGHLVFSSLHTRDAVGAVMRLEEMGIERHLVASSLFVVLSQRLVRILCGSCRQPYECTGNELLSLGIELDPGATLYRPVGCRKCEGTGYLGRTGIFEMLVLDEEVRQNVNNGIDEDALFKLANRKGFARYREDGAMKVLLGVTTVDEVLKAN